jgi:uncharacterized protein
MMFFQMFDPLYWLLIGPTMLLALIAQMWVKSAFSRYNRMGNARGLTGAEAAAEMMRREGLEGVNVEMADGMLSDHYDPRTRSLHLSREVYNGRSVSAVGVACHEAGHALQHADGYLWLGLRSTLVPVASFGSKLAWPIIFLGFIMLMLTEGGAGLWIAKAGVILFATVVLFQFITLPVEFNASSRAKLALYNNGVLARPEEIDGVNSVLNAAAMTYIAAAVAALAQLLYWAIRLGLLGGRD